MVAYTFYEPDNRVRRYAETLVKRGDSVDAIVLRQKGQSPFDVIGGVHVHRIQQRVINEGNPLTYLIKLLLFLLRSAWMLAWRHLRAPYDLIHVHSVPDFQVFATLIPRLMGAKVILDIHDIVPELYASKFRISQESLLFRLLVVAEKISAAYVHHVIIANDIWHERLVGRSTSPEHCTTILNYPDPSIFHRRPRTKAASGEFVMCYPGTLSWHQGVDLVIRAMALVAGRAPGLKLLIIGDGLERRNLLALARECGLEDRVQFSGMVPIEKVAEAMANVDLGIEPKRKRSFANEAFSTKIPEFMAVGVPVLASDTRLHELYFKDGVIEFFESENVEDLAGKILALARNPARCDELRARGRAFIEENNWDVKKGQYLDLVERLAGKRPAERPADGCAARVATAAGRE